MSSKNCTIPLGSERLQNNKAEFKHCSKRAKAEHEPLKCWNPFKPAEDQNYHPPEYPTHLSAVQSHFPIKTAHWHGGPSGWWYPLVSRARAAPALSWHLHRAVAQLPYVWSGSSPTETVPCLPHWVPSTLLIHPLQCSVSVSKKQFLLSGDLMEKYNSMKWPQPTSLALSPVSPDRTCCPSLSIPHTHFQFLMNNNND